jgi:acetyl-CoA carboxylase biotin carboxyl carrier protein
MMDIKKIEQLIDLIEKREIAEIEIREGDDSVRISRTSSVVAPVAAPAPVMVAAAPVATVAAPAASTTSGALPGHVLRSPMVGTVYLSASPEAENFVKVGQAIKTGDVVCLVEAMKMFNQIEADKTGTITACLVKSGEPIEFDQPLFVIE